MGNVVGRGTDLIYSLLVGPDSDSSTLERDLVGQQGSGPRGILLVRRHLLGCRCFRLHSPLRPISVYL